MKKKQNQSRNWVLVVVASVIILVNIFLLVFAIMNVQQFGWWSLGIALAAISSIFLSGMAIKKNEPAWLLLDLILPN